MKTYTAKECSCWCKYPNPYYNKNGHSKCLEYYRNVSTTNNVSRKTKCVLIEVEKDKSEAQKEGD
jgi:hypothetical protein